MQVSVETISGLERKMTVQIPKQRLDSEIQSRLKKLAGTVKIAGFRPGKVPMAEIKRRYGGRVEQEAWGELVQNSYYEALSQEKLRPAGMPQIEPVDSEKNAEEVSYTATFEVYPEITLQGISDISIEKPTVDISDKDIDEMVETIRKQRKEWKEADKQAAEGDRIIIDFSGSIDGEVFEGGQANDYPLELGAKRMIPGFEEQLTGVSAGEEKTISVTFPEQYHSSELAGKAAEFKVTVKKVEESVLPEVNEEFVKLFGISDGGVDAFREQVKSNMAREAQQKVNSEVKKQVMDGLVEKNQPELPKALVDSEIQALMKQQQEMLGAAASQLDNVDPSAFEDQARRRVSLGLILNELVKQNDLKVEPAKLREFIETLAAGYEQPDQVVKYYYSDKQRLAEMENIALEEVAVEWVESQATVTEKTVGFQELMNPSPAEQT